MKKIFAILLLLAIVAILFTACVDDEFQPESVAPTSYYEFVESYHAPTVSLPQLPDNAHPFAVRLHEILAENDVQKVFLVDVDGNHTEGMLIIVNSYGTLYYLYKGEMFRKDMGFEGAGIVSARTVKGNRLVRNFGDGGDFGRTLFKIESGELDEEIKIGGGTVFCEISPYGSRMVYEYRRPPSPLRELSYEEYNEMLERYNLDNLRAPWWELETDDREIILAMNN